MMKMCPKCKIRKDESEWYHDIAHRGGFSSYCKECCTNCTKQYRQTKKGKLMREKEGQKRRKNHPIKYKATNAVNNAIRDGKLISEPCEFCGINYDIQGHHHDYNQPRNVMWLCRICHRILHEVI